MGLVGGILVAIGVVLFFVQRHYRLKLRSLQLATPATTAELRHLQRQVAREIGGGHLREYVKITGHVTTGSPLISPLTQTPCVYYKMLVTREYEEENGEIDVKAIDVKAILMGNSEGQTYRPTPGSSSETVSSHSQLIPFRLRDRYGEVEVEATGAEIETVKVLDEFRPASDPNCLSFGSFTLNTGNLSVNRSTGTTLGYRYQEWILPVDRSVLIVGSASDQTGALRIERPTTRGQKFFISLKSEESLSQDTRRAIRYASLGAGACGGLGLVLILMSLF